MSDREMFIRCDCHSPEHMLLFDTWQWDDPYPHSELIVSVGMDNLHPWWKRLSRAFEYALTGKTKGYQWAETVVKREDAERIRDYLNEYLADA